LVQQGDGEVWFVLQKDDAVEGYYEETNLHYYPNNYIGGHGELIPFPCFVKIVAPNDNVLYDFGQNSSGVFSFIAQKSGIYHFSVHFSCVYGVENPILPTVNVNFTISGAPIKIALTSPLNQTCQEANVTLAYGVSRPSEWFGYSLDGQENVTVWKNIFQNWDTSLPDGEGNLTLAGLTNGVHRVTVYANDTFGNMDSQTVAFTVNADFWVFPVVLVVVAVVVTAAVLLFYRRRQKAV